MTSEVPTDTVNPAERRDLLRVVAELRQRHLFRIAAAYAVGAWLMIQVVDIIGPAFNLPQWMLRAVILAAVAGFLGTMAVLLFRPRHDGGTAAPIYLSRRARLIAGAGVLVIAVAAATFAIRSVSESEPVTLAVLPFADLSPQRDKGFLADGVAEEILSKLGENPDIRVMGRTSSWALRDRAADPQALRASLGLTHLLEGSVRAAGPQLRLSVRLLRTADGSQEWAEHYEGRNEDVFALQDRIAQAVAARLSSAKQDRPQTASAEITSADAYNLYLAARQIARTRTEPELKRAYALARKVVEGQPDYAPGHALFAELTYMLSDGANSYGTIPLKQARRIGVPHARKAIELAPKAADGYAALGLVGPPDERLSALQHAMRLDPARSELPLWTALELVELDRFKEALSYVERAAAIDPLWPAAVSRLAIDLNMAGFPERARREIDAFAARGGDPSQVARFRATAGQSTGDLSELVRWTIKALQLNSAIPYVGRHTQRALFIMGIDPPIALNLAGQPIRDRFYRHGLDAAVSAEPLSTELWGKTDVEYFIYAAGAKRDWPRLAAFYDLRKDAFEELCLRSPYMLANFAEALRRTGRGEEAQRLIGCAAKAAARIQYAGPRRIGAIAEAEVAALSGNSARALDLLENAVQFGWTGKTARLTDMPALDPLSSDPRYGALQRRLDQWIARERQETLALLSKARSA